MSIDKKSDGVYKIRWWEGGRQKSVIVHGSFELAKKVHRKKLSARDENRHLDAKREINYRMSALIDRYWQVYGSKKSPILGKRVFSTASGRNLARSLCVRWMVSRSRSGSRT